MKTVLAALLTMTLATTASAQPAEPDPAAPPAPAEDCCDKPGAQTDAPGQQPPQVAAFTPAAPADTTTGASEPALVDGNAGWGRPAGRRFLHGFRIGWMYVMNADGERSSGGESRNLKMELGLKTPHMMVLGYEGFYRIVGHSWLNVLLVGNISVAGLEQSKPIPAASGLLGFEFNESFQLGVGVNLTPDTKSPSHMIVAAGWTPKVGAIHTPIHFFFVPDPGGAEAGNHRMGATVGMTW